MPQLKYSRTEKNRALRLYNAGMRPEPIEDLTGVKQQTTRKLARQAGVIRPRSETSLTQKEQREAEELYVKGEYSCTEVAAILKVSEYVVLHHLQKKGLTRDPGDGRRAKYRKKQRKARKLFHAGLKLKVIAKRVGVHPRTIGIWKKRYNWEAS